MEKEIKITEEMLHALFEGKKLVLNEPNFRLTLYPPHYGVFMTHEKMQELRRKIGFQALADTDGFFREIFGDEMVEKIFNNKESLTNHP